MAQGFGGDQYSSPQSPGGGAASSMVSGPAIGLIVVGALGGLGALYNLYQGFFGGAMVAPPEMQQDADAMKIFDMIKGVTGTMGIVLGLIQGVVSALIIFGGIKMRSLQSYGLAMTSSVLAMIPCVSGCCIIGLPIGIWSIVVLSKPEVKSAFH